MLKVNIGMGFFSCCSVRLIKIIEYLNDNGKLPEDVDTTAIYQYYKPPNYVGDNVFYYFEHYNNVVVEELTHITSINQKKWSNDPDTYFEPQFSPYKEMDLKNITPLIKKYFTPVKEIQDIIVNLENKYALDYDNLCVLFYRGIIKSSETPIASYDDFAIKAHEVKNKNPNIKFLIQSQEKEFYERMLQEFPDSIHFKDEIRTINRSHADVDHQDYSKNHLYSRNFVAITNIMSKCKHIICGSGNCDNWIIFYRGNTNNVHQSLNLNWIDSDD